MLLQSDNSRPGKLSDAAIEARSSMYRLLASFFARELTQERIVSFQKGNGSQLLDALGEIEAYAAFIRRLKKYFSKIEDPQITTLDLAESYAWSFYGVGGPRTSPLCASVYLSKSASTHQEAEKELRKIIRGQGLSSENADNEAYDHLSVILEFIAWLDEAEGSDKHRDSAQKIREEIIEKYLLSWLPAFVAQCTRADMPGFYSGLAAETLFFAEADYARSAPLDSAETGSTN